MAIEGIFRKNGNIRRLQQISDALDKDSTTVNLSEENPVQLAALLKRFLREMPDPLLTFRLHKLFCAAACEWILASIGISLTDSFAKQGRTPAMSAPAHHASTAEQSGYHGGLVCVSQMGRIVFVQG